MAVVYTRHARHRMKWRKISETEVKKVLENPDRKEPYQVNIEITNIYKQVGKKYLRVSYKQQGNDMLIISVVDKSD